MTQDEKFLLIAIAGAVVGYFVAKHQACNCQQAAPMDDPMAWLGRWQSV